MLEFDRPVKAELKRKGVTYAQLVERLAAIGVVDAEVNIRNKLSRGKFTALIAMLRRYWSVVAVCLALASGSALGQSSQPAGHDAGSQASASESAQQPRAGVEPIAWPTIGDALQRIGAALETANNKQPSPEESENASRDLTAQENMAKWAANMFWVGLSEIGVTLVGLILIYATFRATRHQLAVAHRANEIAWEGVRSGQQARAFVRNIESGFLAEKSSGTILLWRFTPVWMNSGSTPTVAGRSCVNIMERRDILPPDFDYPDYAAADQITIPPNSFRFAGTFELPIEDLVAVRERNALIYVWGWIEYEDIFPDSQVHRSEFCMQIEVTGNPIYVEGGFAYKSVGPFNGMDAECMRQPQPRP